MKLQQNLLYAALCLTVSITSRPTSALAAKLRLLQELPKNTATLGSAFTKDFIFTATAEHAGANSMIVNIHDAKSELLMKSVTLPHTITQIEQSGENSVMIIGRLITDRWDGYYTSIQYLNGEFVSRTFKLPNQQMFDGLSPSARGDNFVSDMGTNSLFRKKSQTFQRVERDFLGAGRVISDEQYLWVLERGDLFRYGDERVTKVELKNTRNSAPMHSDPTNFRGINDILPLVSNRNDSNRYLLATNVNGNQIQTFEKATGKLAASLDLDFAPYQLTEFGSCVAVLGHDDRRLVVGEVQPNGAFAILSTVNLAEVGEQLKKPRRINVSNLHHKVLVRSAYPCPTCDSTQSSDVIVDFANDQDIDSCF